MTEFSLRISGPAGSPFAGTTYAEYWIDSRDTLIDFTTEIGGGFGTMQVGGEAQFDHPVYGTVVEPAYLPQRVTEVRPFLHVSLSAGITTVWEGRMIAPERDGYGNVISFQAEGYWSALADTTFQTSSSALVSSGELVAVYLDTFQPGLSLGNDEEFQDSQAEIDLTDVNGMTGQQLFEHLSQIGDPQGRPYDMGVWERRRVHGRARVAPSVPHYAVPLDGRVSIDEDWSDLWGRARLRYTDFSDNEQVTDWIIDEEFQDRYGILREVEINGGQMRASVAERVVLTYLEEHRNPRYSVTVNRPHGDGLERSDGGLMPSHLVRAGQWARVADLPLQVITATSCNVTTGEASFTLGEARKDFDQLLGRLDHDAATRRAGTNPVTGAKER